jgi:hypothetical protein
MHMDTPIPVGHVNGWPEQRGKRVTGWPAVFAKEPFLFHRFMWAGRVYLYMPESAF